MSSRKSLQQKRTSIIRLSPWMEVRPVFYSVRKKDFYITGKFSKFPCILIMSQLGLFHTKVSPFQSFHGSCRDVPVSGQTHDTMWLTKIQKQDKQNLETNWPTWIWLSLLETSCVAIPDVSTLFLSLSLNNSVALRFSLHPSCICFITCCALLWP